MSCITSTINTITNFIWFMVFAVYALLIFISISPYSKFLPRISFFVEFALFGKAMSKSLIYIIEAVIIGVLLSTLTVDRSTFIMIKDSRYATNVLIIVFECWIPLFCLMWFAELFSFIKEKVITKEPVKKKSIYERISFILFPTIIMIVAFVASNYQLGVNFMKNLTFTTQQWISICSIIVSLLIAASSWIYTAYNTYKNNRPILVISLKHFRLAGMNRYLLLQNLGKTTADIQSVTAEWDSKDNKKVDLSIWNSITFAVGQMDTIYLPENSKGKLTIKVKYSKHNKPRRAFEDSFVFNINKEMDLEYTNIDQKDVPKYLADIARGIQELKK